MVRVEPEKMNATVYQIVCLAARHIQYVTDIAPAVRRVTTLGPAKRQVHLRGVHAEC